MPPENPVSSTNPDTATMIVEQTADSEGASFLPG
jgi:hypothetical protein